MEPEEVGRILHSLNSATYGLNPCSFRQLCVTRQVVKYWMQEIVSASLREEIVPSSLKEGQFNRLFSCRGHTLEHPFPLEVHVHFQVSLDSNKLADLVVASSY